MCTFTCCYYKYKIPNQCFQEVETENRAVLQFAASFLSFKIRLLSLSDNPRVDRILENVSRCL